MSSRYVAKNLLNNTYDTSDQEEHEKVVPFGICR